MNAQLLPTVVCGAALLAALSLSAAEPGIVTPGASDVQDSIVRVIELVYEEPGFASQSCVGEAVSTDTNGLPCVITVRATIPRGIALKGTNIYTYTYSCSAVNRIESFNGAIRSYAYPNSWWNSDNHSARGQSVTLSGMSHCERRITTYSEVVYNGTAAVASGVSDLCLTAPGAPIKEPIPFLPIIRILY